MKNKYISESADETKKIGGLLAEKILKLNKPQVIFLKGDLGSGKTTFVKGFLKAAGVQRRILSPTFVIAKKYKTRKGKISVIIHVDGYRLIGAKIKDLRDIVPDSERAILIVEWPEAFKRKIKRTCEILFNYGENSHCRIIEIK